ncbi:MAG: DEAD/DEAH box helicase [Spirochaetales bacterium]|nr:DEAD/DEAH box helicase [Spirochaetales bacterium]
MKTLYLPELDTIDKPDNLDELKSFLNQNRLYNLKSRENSHSAYILPPRKPMPLQVRTALFSNRLEWSCECGSGEPCSHWWMLILKLQQENLLAGEEAGKILLNILEDKPKQEKEPDPFEGLSLFSGMDLFSTEEEEEEEDRYKLIFQLYENSEDELLLIRPMLRHILADGREGNIVNWKREKLTEPLSQDEDALLYSMTKEIAERGDMAARDFTGDWKNLPLCFGTRGLAVNPVRFDNLYITFKLHNYLPDRGVIFQPLFTLRSGETAVTQPLPRKKLEISGGAVLHLSDNRQNLYYIPEQKESSYFIKLLLSRSGGFLEKDLHGLKGMAAKLGINSIHLDLSNLATEIRKEEPKPILKIRNRSDRTEVFFYFRYGDQEIPSQMLENYKTVQTPENILVYQRDRSREKAFLATLTNLLEGELQYERGYYSGFVAGEESEDLRLGIDISSFLSYYGAELQSAGAEVQLENRPIALKGELSFQVKKESDLLKVNTEVKLDEETAQIMLDEYYKTHGLVRAGNNYVVLDDDSLAQLDKLSRQGLSDEGDLEASLSNIPVLETLSQATEGEESLIEENLSTLRSLESVSTIEEAPLPKRFKAELRHYQVHGYNWLNFLHDYGLNGCLADDMGLGKTVQTLAFLQGLKERGDLGTSLLITPVVTLPNWEGELQKFAPEIRYLRHSGRNRADHSDYFKDLDLVIVSYQTIRYDIELFLDREYDYVILDEGHYIKNASSQTFKAIVQLKSRHRLSLTGTPIENNTSELWSQMNFLNPGLLGTMREFQERFAIPIEKQQDEDAAGLLRKTVFPFILRRKKEEVATDLPPREEILHYLDMSSEQEEVYNRQKDFYRALVDGLLEREGLQKASIEIFSYILKMRQLAIHPPMAGEDYRHIPSCKMDSLVNLLDKLQGEDHKVLIFSQFLGTLESLRRLFESRHWLYSHITGETEDRRVEIDRFQNNPDVRIFLLSLKAGGIGINLTAADYVILFDPWWNPAVERQAVDRAYRIGQKRKVITYKFITRNTIEEKILAMQEEKKDLADKIITEEQGFVKNLSGREILDLFN